MAGYEIQIEEVIDVDPDDNKGNESSVLIDDELSQSKPMPFIEARAARVSRSDRRKKLSVYFIVILPIIAHFIGQYYYPDTSKYKVIVAIIAFTLFWLYASILIALYDSAQVYRIRVYSRQIQSIKAQSVHTTVPYKVVHYPSHPCGSISEFCATRGSPFYMILLVTCTLISWLLFGLVILEEFRVDNVSNHLFQLGCIGLFTIGIWELHPEDPLHNLLHYYGTTALVCYALAYCMQSKWNALSLMLLSSGTIVWILWLITVKAVRCAPLLVKKSQDPKAVKRTSVALIVMEMIFIALFLGAAMAFILNLEG